MKQKCSQRFASVAVLSCTLINSTQYSKKHAYKKECSIFCLTWLVIIASPRLINGCSYSHADAQNKHLLKHEKYKLTITS
ncbi:hypothetical protein T01_2489 [Trichinella spiralis]|uniref:Uncharacterized protein n=1 Tax=Trichinella spiralis TaxID=6334 RepID=A0A0V1BTM3_TRISP|nr:hypothetical protein T01_2489 [Trichinella spiralis]